MIELVQFVTEAGICPFADWFHDLDHRAALKVRTALARMELEMPATRSRSGRASGTGVDWGPGYRIYFGRDGDRIVVLLAGGTKKRQSSDIARAQALWAEYRRRRKER